MTTPDTVDTSRDSEDSIRVYSSSGILAHNVWSLDGSCIYCKRHCPPAGWRGIGTEAQRAKALTLPYCKERQR